MSEAAENSKTDRIVELDGFRGVAILLVAVYRFGSIAFSEELVGTLASKAILLGAAGVDFFFVLSGFLITGILLNAKSKSNKSYFADFYFRRILRIFPLYFGTLFVVLLLLPAVFDVRLVADEVRGNPIHLWLFTTNLAISWRNEWCYGSLNHLWSIAIEEQFYLIWPFLVYYTRRERLIQVCLIAFFAFAGLRIGYSFLGIGDVSEKAFTLFRLDGLLLGAVACVVMRNIEVSAIICFRARIGAVFTSVLFLLTLPLRENDYTVRYSLVAMVAAMWIVSTLTSQYGSIERRLLRSRFLGSLGRYSYGMYIIQAPLICLLAPSFSPEIVSDASGSKWIGAIVYFTVMFVANYTLAVVSWHGFEAWFLKRPPEIQIKTDAHG